MTKPKSIFPSSITEFSEESFIHQHSTKSKAIYWLLIFSIIGIGTSIFYIRIEWP